MSYPEIASELLQSIGVIGFVGTGIFAAINVFDNGRKKRQSEADLIDSRVITGLKEEMALQSGIIQRMENDLRELRDNNLKLASENKTLRDILQGRDDVTIKYQADGRVAMEHIKAVLKHQEQVTENINRLTVAVEKFVNKEAHTETSTTTTTTSALAIA